MAKKTPKNPFTLFELSDKIKAIVADIIEADIAGDEDEVQALIAELDGLHEAKRIKARGVRACDQEFVVHGRSV